MTVSVDRILAEHDAALWALLEQALGEAYPLPKIRAEVYPVSAIIRRLNAAPPVPTRRPQR